MQIFKLTRNVNSNNYAIIFFLSLLIFQTSCFIKEKCYSNEDCTDQKICDKNSGECKYQCITDMDCGPNFRCENHICIMKSTVTLTCPEDMANIENTFCMDKFEASRPDATENFEGRDSFRATSRKGVLPWMTKNNKEAEEACKNAGKRLCSANEWFFACAGEEKRIYSYGNKYDPSRCNGIDTFCYCDSEECSGLSSCPYPHCYNQPSLEGGGPCDSNFHLMPTGSFPECKNIYGVYDLNGNVWEHIMDGSEYTVRGGAYNCGDSEKLSRCDYIPATWKPSALGFRCCSDGLNKGDAGIIDITLADKTESDLDIIAENTEDTGCIEEDIISLDTSDDYIVKDITEIERDDEQSPDAGVDFIEDIELEDNNPADIPIDMDITEDTVTSLSCPEDMVNIENKFCIDRYEASRPDATRDSQGSDSSFATSKEGVIPWYSVTLSIAKEACKMANKRLCKPEEWFFACSQNGTTNYVYGNTYNPITCNGIDTFCYCDNPQCSSLSQCPYPHCYNKSSNEGGGPCGSAFRVMPTGSFKDCRNQWGVYDLNGNVWEIVDTEDGLEHFRGGAYNCGDSEMLHRCDYDATWGPSAKGFRCCKDLE